MPAGRVTYTDNQFKDYHGVGSGKEGQIKIGSWWSRSIAVSGLTRKLNRGSLIDFINSRLPKKDHLKKGFFGIGGSSNREIRIKLLSIAENTLTLNKVRNITMNIFNLFNQK